MTKHEPPTGLNTVCGAELRKRFCPVSEITKQHQKAIKPHRRQLFRDWARRAAGNETTPIGQIQEPVLTNSNPARILAPFVCFRSSEIANRNRPCPSGWVPLTRVHLGQRTGRPAEGRSHNTQHQTRQKKRTTDAGPRTTAPRNTSIPTTTEQFQLLGRRPHGRLLLFRDLAAS